MSPRQPINWFLLNTIYFFDAISIQARQFTFYTYIWIHHFNMYMCKYVLSVCDDYVSISNEQTNKRNELKKNWNATAILRIIWNVGMPSKEHAHTHNQIHRLSYTHLLGFFVFIKINRDICNCCEWQTINHLLPRSLHATRALTRSLASPTWSQLVRFILLVWLGWLPGLYMNICCTYFICSLCMDYSNQIKSNRNDCKSTPYYILELRTFPFWLLLRLLLLLFPCFSLSHLGCWCFFCVLCRNNNTINGKKQNMVEHLNKTTTTTKRKNEW